MRLKHPVEFGDGSAADQRDGACQRGLQARQKLEEPLVHQYRTRRIGDFEQCSVDVEEQAPGVSSDIGVRRCAGSDRFDE